MVDPDSREFDPVYVHSLRELKVILLVFAAFAAYVVSVAFVQGGQEPPSAESSISTVWGIPSWVFWSIVVPWLAANLVTGWFCFRFLKKDPLEEKARITGALSAESSMDRDAQASAGKEGTEEGELRRAGNTGPAGRVGRGEDA